ncbi:hypothetical protein ACA910_010698 [Epithemia clementina (nom. ined.)]
MAIINQDRKRDNSNLGFQRDLFKSKDEPNAWEYALLSFAVAVFLVALVLAIALVKARCSRSRPPKVIKRREQRGQDEGLPANDTGSMSACSDVTSRDLASMSVAGGAVKKKGRKDAIAVIDESEEDVEVQACGDGGGSSQQSNNSDNESEGLWDYSVYSFTGTIGGGASVSEWTRTSSVALARQQSAPSVTSQGHRPSNSNSNNNLMACREDATSAVSSEDASRNSTTSTMVVTGRRRDSEPYEDERGHVLFDI